MGTAKSQTSGAPTPDREPLWVFFFGDSICFGQGVSIYKGWVPRLSATLAQVGEERGHAVGVHNLSVNGNTTRLALERMPYDIQSHEPDLLLVQFGMNDCNFWESDRGNPRVSLDAFRANLREIYSRAYSFGVHNVIQLTNHPSGRSHKSMPHTKLTYQQNNERYNEAIREVAAEGGRDVMLVDVEAAWQKAIQQGNMPLESLVLSDGLHLSERGHDLYFETVAPPLRAAVVEVMEARGAMAPGLVAS